MEDVDENNPPSITFYKYIGNKGLYPLTFNSNHLINIKSNLTIDESLDIKKDVIIDNNLLIKNNLNINNDLRINNNVDITNHLKVANSKVNELLEVNTVDFDKYNELPAHNNKNKLVCTDESLYFYHNNTWNNLINTELFTFSYDHFVYNITDDTKNKININKNLTIIEISETLTDNIYIELPIITKNGVELTIIMGQSVSEYVDEFNIIILGNVLTSTGIGPNPANIKFTKTGQAIKIMSIFNKKSDIYGYNNNYYQILYNNYTSIIIDDDTQINQTIDDQIIQYRNYEERPFDPTKVNSVDLSFYHTIIQLDTPLTEDIYIILPLIDTAGVEKIITFDKSVADNFNNKKIVVYGKFIEPSGFGPIYLNIEFIQAGQSLKVVSIKSRSDEMYSPNFIWKFSS